VIWKKEEESDRVGWGENAVSAFKRGVVTKTIYNILLIMKPH